VQVRRAGTEEVQDVASRARSAPEIAIVEAIQGPFPPQGGLPPPGQDDQAGGVGEDRIDRAPVPGWLAPGQGSPVPPGGHVVIEDGAPPGAGLGGPLVHHRDLAFYLPFHFYGQGTWGIYLRASGVAALARDVAGSAWSGGGPADQSWVALAESVLFEHERFHFLTEMACASMELVAEGVLPLGAPAYADYFRDREATALEEALCNAHALRAATRGRAGLRKSVAAWMSSQGPGYNSFGAFLGRESFQRGQRGLAERMVANLPQRYGWGKGGVVAGRRGTPIERVRPAPVPGAPLEFLFPVSKGLRAPTRYVLDAPNVDVLRPFPAHGGVKVETHSREHPPPHIHVEIPPGKPLTRLVWPSLEPVPGDPAPSRAERRKIDDYLRIFGKGVDERVRAVYG
jgi:hypothetical protein